ncbi:hypothetical protein CHELA1G11_12699 [Hyphomicrobiales bacterium]|nr:hypothetical protein CHELA1G2_11607 [Hyphomicrobiales bacterium]CAH1666507.1 hypothetical protein CHELA1G11_12699 [Hyphomicrobiales bacterium]
MIAASRTTGVEVYIDCAGAVTANGLFMGLTHRGLHCGIPAAYGAFRCAAWPAACLGLVFLLSFTCQTVRCFSAAVTNDRVRPCAIGLDLSS